MSVREILKMGAPGLLRVARPVARFDTPELHELVHPDERAGLKVKEA